MSSLEMEKSLYMDLEKFHRVIGYYEGQKIKPLAVHQKHIADNLEKSFRAPDQYIKRLQFDLFMKHVLCDEKQIFETDKPEVTLLYLLFAEGIKSLVMLRDITATEFKDWCVLVRETLVALDTGTSKDLASVLWKTPFRNLRARIYNTLMDFRDQRNLSKTDAPTPMELQQNSDILQEVQEREKDKPEWHKRDSEWDIPSAENLFRSEESSLATLPSEILNLKKKLTKAKQETEENELLRISNIEVELLSSEMSSYDQSQVEFNLLAWDTSVLEGSFGCDPSAVKFIENSIASLAESFVGQFHPGLTVHLMDQVEKFGGAQHKELRDRLASSIGKSLNSLENHKRLLDALQDSHQRELAQRLLPFLERDHLPQIIDHFLEKDDADSLVNFLETIFRRDLPIEEILMGWGEVRLAKVLPLFRRINWSQKADFLVKALRSRHPQIVREASQYLNILSLRADHALDIYRKLPEETQEVWMKTLKGNDIPLAWKPFVEALAKSEYWVNLPLRLQTLWCEIFFKTLGDAAFPILHPWVSARNYVVWPKFPVTREAALTAAFDVKSESGKKLFAVWLKHESQVKFQDPILKERLERKAKT